MRTSSIVFMCFHPYPFPGEPGKTFAFETVVSGASASVSVDTSAVRPGRSYALCARNLEVRMNMGKSKAALKHDVQGTRFLITLNS